MSELDLRRKYRPLKIEEYLGSENQRHVKDVLNKTEKLPQSILIHGGRRCGKTALTDILLKYYLCEKLIDGKPCEECGTCQTTNDTIINGRVGSYIPGVIDVNVCETSNMDLLVESINKAKIPPNNTKYKIIVFDDLNIMSSRAQNQLIPLLEDMPEHLICLMCATDKEKIIGALEARCQLKVKVEKVTADDLIRKLYSVAKIEGIKIQLEALDIIVEQANRVPGAAMLLLEAAVKNNGKEITVEDLQ